MRVQNRLGLASGAGGIKNEERIFRIHFFGGAFSVCDGKHAQVVIPVIAPGFHRHAIADTFDHNHVFHGGTLLKRLVYNRFEFHHFPVLVRPVTGDDQFRFAVFDAPLQRVNREAAEHHRMDRADLGACQHGKDDLRHASHVNGDAVAFGDAHGFDDVCHAGYFAVHGKV